MCCQGRTTKGSVEGAEVLPEWFVSSHHAPVAADTHHWPVRLGWLVKPLIYGEGGIRNCTKTTNPPTAKEQKKLESFLNRSLGDLNLSQFSINSCLDYHEFWDNMLMSTASERKNEVAPLCRKVTVPILIFTSFSVG